MPPNIKRRTFLQSLFGIPALAALWPRAVQAQAQIGLVFSDSDGNTDFSTLHDGNPTTGITYAA